MKSFAKPLAILAVAVLATYLGVWKWMFCRIYVDPDEILVITARLGTDNPDPENQRVVPAGTKGVWRAVLGEGRHFFNPIEYATDTKPKVTTVEPDQVAVVVSMSGKPLSEGQFLAEEGYKGTLRAPLTPGKWRLNPAATRVHAFPATIIRPGYVGCVTLRSGKPSPQGQLAEPGQRGIQKSVLQPGVYYLNPEEFKVEAVEVGYSQTSFENVSFPSKDGFTIQLDISVVWGLLPKDVPFVINQFGNIDAIVDKFIRPQVESICRIEGSKYGGRDFIDGTTRELFQKTFTEQFVHEATSRNVDVLIGLVRDIHVPLDLREKIQNEKIAIEETLTKEEQRNTQIVLNELDELRSEVKKGEREVTADTEKLVAAVRSNAQSKVETIRADLKVAVAEIRKEVAEINAERDRILGKADADVIELLQKAGADRFQKNVAAIGDPEAYANYIFATRLSQDLKIYLRYAGPGTFWTDLPPGAKSLEEAAARKILEREQGETPKKP